MAPSMMHRTKPIYLFDQALNGDFVFFGNDSVESTENVTFTYYWTIEVGGYSTALPMELLIPGLTEVEVEDDGAGFEASTGSYLIRIGATGFNRTGHSHYS